MIDDNASEQNGRWLGPLLLTSVILWAVGIVAVVRACSHETRPPAITVTCEHGESSVGPAHTTPTITGCAP